MKDRDGILGRHLDGELGDVGTARLAERLAADPGLRDRLARYERLEQLGRTLGETAPDAPDDLERRVMARLAHQPLPVPPRWRRLVDALLVSPARLAVAGAALVLIGVGLGLAASGGLTAAGRDNDGPVMVHFLLEAPQARSVAVAGTFNAWDVSRNPMERRGGTWHLSIPLEPGRHEYLFVVDGGAQWVVDPAAPATVEDGFGGKNGVLRL